MGTQAVGSSTHTPTGRAPLCPQAHWASDNTAVCPQSTVTSRIWSRRLPAEISPSPGFAANLGGIIASRNFIFFIGKRPKMPTSPGS